MKVAIICYPVKGGSGVVASELGIGLSRRGCQVHFFSYELPFRLTGFETNFIFHEVDISHYPLFKYPPYTITLAARLADESIRYGFDIIHAHYAIPHAAAAYLAAKAIKNNPPKIITTLHGTDITLIGQDKSFYSITRFSIEISDGITAVSRYLQDKTYETFGLKKKIELIPNFVDTERFNPDGAVCVRKILAEPEQKIILHMSNFRPLKNTSHVVKIFDIIQKKIPAKLILIGEGPDTGNVKSLVHELGLSGKVMYLGNQDRVQHILPLADLFLLPSASESFGLVALEALSCGVPVVGSNVGGLPELISDDVNGYLCPIGDIDSMADKSLEILTNDNLSKKLSIGGRQVALDKYKIDNVIDNYLNYYKEVLNG
jgi:N-acetyl-alpha-D-glucosaminyl L-malate synthase BshA